MTAAISVTAGDSRLVTSPVNRTETGLVSLIDYRVMENTVAESEMAGANQPALFATNLGS